MIAVCRQIGNIIEGIVPLGPGFPASIVERHSPLYGFAGHKKISRVPRWEPDLGFEGVDNFQFSRQN